MAKSLGQLDYEADVKKRPRYSTGRPRATWEQLGPIARSSWEPLDDVSMMSELGLLARLDAIAVKQGTKK